MGAVTCAVLGAGEILNYQRVAQLIAPGAFIVCADGGLRHCQPLKLAPDLLVGDFDSLTTEPPPGVERVSLSVDKNYTDSFHAAEIAVQRGQTQLLLTGMLGGRLDHTLANIALLCALAGQGVYAMLTDGATDAYGLAGGGKLVLPHRQGCYFSVLALEQCEQVTIQGGKYPLKGYSLRADDPRAISNEFTPGKDVTISQRAGLLAAIVSPMNNA